MFAVLFAVAMADCDITSFADGTATDATYTDWFNVLMNYTTCLSTATTTSMQDDCMSTYQDDCWTIDGFSVYELDEEYSGTTVTTYVCYPAGCTDEINSYTSGTMTSGYTITVTEMSSGLIFEFIGTLLFMLFIVKTEQF